MFDTLADAQRLVESMTDGGAISGSAYDTAWVASVPDPERPGQPLFPHALAWLAENQHADGSWGGSIKYHHDRMLATAACLIPLARYGKRTEDRDRIARGERYIWQNLSRLHNSAHLTVGFEVLFPAMIEAAGAAGLRLPRRVHVFEADRSRKLDAIPPQMLYARDIPFAHSLEFLGERVDLEQLARVRAANGSVHNSPSASAYFLHHAYSDAVRGYLDGCLALDSGRAVPVLYPLELFEFLWACYHLHLGGVPLAVIGASARWDMVARELARGGVGLSTTFPVPDADDTGVALKLLAAMGRTVDWAVLKQFEHHHHFVSYPFENHSSVGVNAHILHALVEGEADYAGRAEAVERILVFLAESQIDGLYWLDKWHVSPYYATSHVVIALCPLAGRREIRTLLDGARDWLINSQNANGSWGHYGQQTNEETALALQGLLHYHRRVAPLDETVLHRAGRFLMDHYHHSGHETLWIGKALYCPPRIVAAAIIGALHHYHRLFPSREGGVQQSGSRPELAASGDGREAL